MPNYPQTLSIALSSLASTVALNKASYLLENRRGGVAGAVTNLPANILQILKNQFSDSSSGDRTIDTISSLVFPLYAVNCISHSVFTIIDNQFDIPEEYENMGKYVLPLTLGFGGSYYAFRDRPMKSRLAMSLIASAVVPALSGVTETIIGDRMNVPDSLKGLSTVKESMYTIGLLSGMIGYRYSNRIKNSGMYYIAAHLGMMGVMQFITPGW